MAMVTIKPGGGGPQRPRRGADYYSTHLRTHPGVQIDPSMFPAGGLGDLGDPGDTGIDLVDDVHHQIQEAAFYARVTAGFAVAAGITSACALYLLWPRRRR